VTIAQLTILVVDDEAPIRRALRNALQRAELLSDVPVGEVRVVEGASVREAIDLAAAEQPALVVLDLGLPDGEGLNACREIRRWSTVPIVVLSARHDDAEKVALLDAGADDYVTKPFSPAELVARLRVQLRHARTPARAHGAITTFGEWSFDAQRRRLERNGTPVHLTPTEFLLLRAFVSHPRQLLTHRQLFAEVWGNAEGDPQQYLRVYVGQLRRKIERDPVRPEFIHTEQGVGYRFEPTARASSD
jgi:two-component system KDP operon response regulator KdpE